MPEKEELTLGEWCLRMTLKLLAFGAVGIALLGIAIVLDRTIEPLLNQMEYGATASVTVAGIAAFFGLTPMGLFLDKTLLRFCGMSKDWRKQPR